MTCANCSNDAVYEVNYRTAPSVNYCEKCVPAHVREGARVLSKPSPVKRRRKAADSE